MNNEPINDTTTTPIQQKHSHHKAKLAIILVIIFLLGAGAGFCVNQFLLPKNASQQETTSSESSPQPTTTNDASSDTNFAPSESDKAVLDVIAELDKVSSSHMTITDGQSTSTDSGLPIYNYTFPLYFDEQAQTATALEKSYGLYWHYDSKDAKWDKKGNGLNDVITKKLKELGFEKYRDIDAWHEEYINSQSGVICDAGGSTNPYKVVCGHTSWLSEEKLALVRALAKADPDEPLIDADPAKITDSTNAPYQKLTVGLSNAAGLFYRTSPDSEWVFIDGTQDFVPCEKFNNDARKAYAGEKCYDKTKNKEITL